MRAAPDREHDVSTLVPELVEQPEALQDLAPDWDALLERSRAPSLFLSHAWITTWWSVFGGGRRLHVVVLRDREGSVQGIAPLFVATGVEGLPRALRVLMLIGQRGDTLAEELDVIAAPGRETSVAAALARHLVNEGRSTWDAIDFERVRAEGATALAVMEALREAGFVTERSEGEPSPYLPLPESMDTLLEGLSKNFRRQLRSARNRLERDGKVEFQRAAEQLPLDEAMEVLVRLHRKRWGPGDGSFDSEAYLAFHGALSRSLLEAGRLLLVLLRVDGTAVAARYDFLFADRIWCFQGGWDPDYERMRPGTVLTAEVLRWGIEHGYREYAFLSGDDAYKWRWTSQSRTLLDLRVWGRGARPALARMRRSARRALRRIPPLRWLVRRLRRSPRT